MYKFGREVERLRADPVMMRVLKLYESVFCYEAALIASAYAGVIVTDDEWKPVFLFDHRGGILLRGREIIIGQDNCYDSAYRSESEGSSEEEFCVGRAVEFLCANVLDHHGEVGLSEALSAFAKTKGWGKETERNLHLRISRAHKSEADPWRLFFGEHPKLFTL